MSKTYNVATVIGRFQIPHVGHKALFTKAAEIADHVVVVIGSVGQPATPKNPFSFEDRKAMLIPILDEVTGYYPKYGAKRKYSIVATRDQRYNLQSWLVDVVNKVEQAVNVHNPTGAIVGHKKDSTSFYIDHFPQWKVIEVDNVKSLSSSTLRDCLFNVKDLSKLVPYIACSTFRFLEVWKKTEVFTKILEEYKFLKDYKENAFKHPPTYNTVDAVVVQSGHILLVQRARNPGQGLWALPGGFLEQNETLRQAVIRELVEETQIKLQPVILDRNIRKEKTFDDPSRSQRGRTITQAFYIELSGHELPRIKGGSDAKKAKWFPLNEVYSMGENLYEDHLDIILNMTGDR